MKVYPDTIRNAELLESLYISQKLSSGEIGSQLGVDARLVSTWLSRFGVPTRSQREAIQIYWEHQSRRVPKICSVCSKEFTVPLNRAKRAKKSYCSWECKTKDAANSLRKAYRVFWQDHPRIDKICPVCHTAFSVPFSHGKRKNCSKQCQGAAQMIANGVNKTPTIPEQKIIDIVSKHFPDFKYNGNGELAVVLAGMIPDFINTNGKKQVIEVFGDYYHGQLCKNWKDSELGKTMAYNSIGFDCLILWEHDIKSKKDEDIVATIEGFCHPKAKRRR